MAAHKRLDIQAARAAFQQLKTIDLRGASIADLVDALSPVIEGWQTVVRPLQAGQELFRARICGKPFRASELLYPPPALTGTGRCNGPGEPRLYCCSRREATFFEIRPYEGATLAVVTFRTTRAILVNHVGYVPDTFGKFGMDLEHPLLTDPWITQAKEQLQPIMHEVANYLAQIITEIVSDGEKFKYKLTAALARFMDDPKFDGLMYPTVAMAARADNVALKPASADAVLEIAKVEYVRVDQVLEDGYNIRILDRAIVAKGDDRLRWVGRYGYWELSSAPHAVFIVREGDKDVLRDANGRCIGAP